MFAVSEAPLGGAHQDAVREQVISTDQSEALWFHRPRIAFARGQKFGHSRFSAGKELGESGTRRVVLCQRKFLLCRAGEAAQLDNKVAYHAQPGPLLQIAGEVRRHVSLESCGAVPMGAGQLM